MAQNSVDLAGAQSDRHRRRIRQYLPTLGGRDHCDIAELLLAAPILSRQGSTDYGVLPQLVWTLGPLVEASLLLTQPGDRPWPRSWWLTSTLALPTVSGLTTYERAAFLYQYQKETAKSLMGSDCVGVALDDGRVARAPWKLLTAIKPEDNYAFWLMAQARIGWSTGSDHIVGLLISSVLFTKHVFSVY